MDERFLLVLIFFSFMTFSVKEVKCSFKFLLLHTNDMHSHYMEINHQAARCQQPSEKCFGGFARVHAAVKHFTKKAKEKGMPTLYLDAGDVFQETVYYTEFKSGLAIEMMNLLRPQAMSLGNHEFDDGIDELHPFVRDLKVPIVCCNIDTSQEPRLQKISSSIVVNLGEAPNSAKVGIVGYLTQDISKKKLENVKVRDEIESLKIETKRLREEEHVDIIIALGHSGYEKDKKIAEAVSEIDVIVGGHSHTFLYNGKAPSDNHVSGPYPTFIVPINNAEKKIPIVQASYGTKYLGYLELEFDNNWKLTNHKGLPVLLTGNMEQDKEVVDALKDKYDIIYKKYQVKVGYTEVTLNGRSAYCRFQECNIGNMITDAFVDHVNSKYTTTNSEPVSIGLIHAGAIKGSLFANTEEGYTGDIALEDIITVLPFKCSLEVLEITGHDLRQVLEEAMDNFDRSKGTNGLFKAKLMQVSGLKLNYDLTREKGQRLVSVLLATTNKEIDNNSKYNVVMPDYLAQGNDFKILSGQRRVASINKEETDYVVVNEFVKKHKKFQKGGKYSKPEGRISIKVYTGFEMMRNNLFILIKFITNLKSYLYTTNHTS